MVIKKRNILAVFAFLLIFSLQLGAQVLDKTVVTVTLYKTENISQSKLKGQYKIWQQQTQKVPTDEDKKSILEATINDVLIMQAARKDRIFATSQQVDEAINIQKQSLGTPISDGDFKNLIEQQTGLVWKDFKKSVENKIIQEQYIVKKYGSKIKNFDAPTDKEIKKLYQQYAQNFTNPAMLRASHLFWDTRSSPVNKETKKKDAYAMASKINGSAKTFDKYFKKSLDDISYQGRDMGYIIMEPRTQNVLGTSFIEALFDLNEGDVSSVLESKSGFHIVKITDKRDPKLLTLNDPIFPGEKVTVKQRVKDLLLQQKQIEQFLKLVKEEVDFLRKKAKIKYFKKNL